MDFELNPHNIYLMSSHNHKVHCKAHCMYMNESGKIDVKKFSWRKCHRISSWGADWLFDHNGQCWSLLFLRTRTEGSTLRTEPNRTEAQDI